MSLASDNFLKERDIEKGRRKRHEKRKKEGGGVKGQREGRRK